MPTTSTWALEYSSPELLLKEQESRSAADGDSPASTTSTGTKPKVLASKCKRNEEGHDTDGKLEELLQQCTRVSREGIEKVKSLSRARAAAEKAPPASQGEEDLKRVDKIVNALLEECTAKRREYDCDYASNKRGGKAGLELLAASVEETKQTTHGAPTAFVNSQTSPMQTSEWRAERDAKLAALATENRDFIMLQLNGRGTRRYTIPVRKYRSVRHVRGVRAGLSELSEEQEAAVRVVVERWLTAEPGALGLTRLTEHHIDVQGASPIKHKMRRMTPAMLQVTHDEIAKMLAQGVIEPSASAWSSAPVIVKKADGSNRFCIDYRDLNKVTKKDAYPVQNIDGILDKLRSAKYISTIDLKSAYFQIAMEESSKQYTAFAVPGAGLFQFTRDAELKLPLLRLTRKSVEWAWTEEQQNAFEALKQALTQAPVLARPDFTKPFIVQTDASAYAIGGVLTQVFDDGEHPIVYVSRVLAAAERNYTTSEKECLALIWTIRKLRPYLEGYRFIAVTDHSALQYLKNLKDPTGRLARWALEMQQWDFEVVHRRGRVHELPDALSRAYEYSEALGEAKIAGVAEVDEEHAKLIVDVEANPRRWKDWRVENGQLYRYRYDALLDPITNCEEGWKLVVPKPLRERVMYDAHDITSSGHLGIEKTFDRVKRDYYWRGMYHDVFEYVRTCDACQRYKISQTGPQGLMGRRVIERPWSVIACDLMEFPASKSQNKYLIVFQDLFTRWIELKPVRRATGKAVASALEELVLFRWETPEFLICDNGKEQVNKDVSEVLDAYGIRQVTTPAYWAAPNPVERSNRTLKTTIALFVGADHRDWDKHLHELRHAINTAVQSSTKVSPAFLNFGRHPRPVKSLRREVEKTDIRRWRVDEHAWLDRIKRLDAIRDLVALHIEKAHERQARHFNRGRKDIRFEVGDMVKYRTHHLSCGADSFNRKLGERYDGPVKITSVISPTVYTIDTPNKKRVSKVNVNDLRVYNTRSKAKEMHADSRATMPQRGAGCSPGTCRGAGRCPTRGQWLERQPPRDRNEDEDILNLDTERDELEEAGGRSSPHLDRTIYFDDPPTVNGSPTVDTTSAGDQVPPDENPGACSLLLLAETNRKDDGRIDFLDESEYDHVPPPSSQDSVTNEQTVDKKMVDEQIVGEQQDHGKLPPDSRRKPGHLRGPAIEPRQSHNVNVSKAARRRRRYQLLADVKAEAKWATAWAEKTDVAAALRLIRQRDNHEAELHRRQELADREAAQQRANQHVNYRTTGHHERIRAYAQATAEEQERRRAKIQADAEKSAEQPVKRRGRLFDGRHDVPYIPGLDVPNGACFTCWDRSHKSWDCRARTLWKYCLNCGRKHVDTHECPRCRQEFLRLYGPNARHNVRVDRPEPKSSVVIQEITDATLAKSTKLEHRATEAAVSKSAKQAEASQRPAPTASASGQATSTARGTEESAVAVLTRPTQEHRPNEIARRQPEAASSSNAATD
ncbi:unnamed protein product [Trichogramma brassicae]|uniref:RNA-directed DNA polymerase n=1 Tax=Trichogramma brassicae TaxID=86971 RepID=A0A6H5IM10_9HYME|nr:unnamed protein product [Trichogramma brassicae]